MINFRWLGTAGVELETDNTILLIDPFLTRPSLWQILAHVPSNTTLIKKYIKPPSAILVTHSHWDHLMDCAEIAKLNNADLYGSSNTCEIMKHTGLKTDHIHKICVNDHFTLGPFQISVSLGAHDKTPLDRWINGPFKAHLPLPLRPIDYRKDEVFSYQFQVGDLSISHGKTDSQVDILLTYPYSPTLDYLDFLTLIRPELIIPIHWDDFLRPLENPLHSMLRPPAKKFPWLTKIDLVKYKDKIEASIPNTRVLIPALFQNYRLN